MLAFIIYFLFTVNLLSLAILGRDKRIWLDVIPFIPIIRLFLIKLNK